MPKQIELNDMLFEAKPVNMILYTKDKRGLSESDFLNKDEFLYGDITICTPTNGTLAISLEETFPFGRREGEYTPTKNFPLSNRFEIKGVFFRSFLQVGIKTPQNTLLFNGLKLKILSDYNTDNEVDFSTPVKDSPTTPNELD